MHDRDVKGFRRSGCAAAAAAALLVASTATHAQEACGDATCPAGYTCEVYLSECPDVDCAEGEECPTCEPVEEYYCARAACESDADCGDEMVCATFERTTCTGEVPVCTEEGECEDVEPVECTTTSYNECARPSELPCNEDADCGAGYACVPTEECWCTGSEGETDGGSTAPDPDAELPDSAAEDEEAAPLATDGDDEAVAEPPPEDVEGEVEPPIAESECGCELTGESHCEMIEVACESDADCLPGWTCEENPMGVCWADSEGNTGCEPADPPYLCLPGYDEPVSGGVDQGDSGGTAMGGTGEAEQPADDGANETDDDEDGQTQDPGAADPAAGDSGPGSRGGRGHRTPFPWPWGWGCTITNGSATSAPGLSALLLGLAAALTARRRRRA